MIWFVSSGDLDASTAATIQVQNMLKINFYNEERKKSIGIGAVNFTYKC